jgi:hypothetical protein
MDRYNCWEATGLAREKFVQLAQEIKVYLETFSEPVLDPVTWSIYMIGKSKATARPTVMFCCRESKSRRTVKKIIDDSGILLNYPGIKTDDSTLPPDFNQLIELSLRGDESDDDLNYSNSAKTVLCPSAEDLTGSRIYINSTMEDLDSLRKATAGGIVQWKDRYFGMTVSHVFFQNLSSSQLPQVIDGCTFEFNLDEDSDGDEIDEESMDTTSRGSLTPESITSEYGLGSDDTFSDRSSQTHSTFNKSSIAEDSTVGNVMTVDNLTKGEPASADPSELPILDVVGNLFLTSTDGPHSDLDYALFEIQQLHLHANGATVLAEKVATEAPKDVEVITNTGSTGILRGRLSGTPSFMRLSQSKNFQGVWTVRLNGRLERRDCGSWGSSTLILENSMGIL